MTLLQNKTVKKLSKKELLQDYVFDKEFAKNVFFSYLTTKDLRSFEHFLYDHLDHEFFEDSQRLYQEKVASGAEDDETLWDKLYRDDSLENDTRMEEISKRPDLGYDLKGFFKIDGVLYYIKGGTAYDLTDAPFEWIVASSVYSFLKHDGNTSNSIWGCAFDFLLHPRFHKELRDLLKNGDFMQTQRKEMLYGFLQALKEKQEWPRIKLTWDVYNFDVIFAFLQFIGENERKARELAQNCVSTMSFQGVIDYLSVLLQLEKGHEGVPLEKGTAGMSCVLKYCK